MIAAAALVFLLQAAPAPGFTAARARLDALNAKEAALTARVHANRDTQARLLAALQAVRREPPPALLVSPGSAKDAVRAAILMKALEPELEQRATALAAESRALAKVRREAAEASSALFSAESAAAERAVAGAKPASAAEPSPTPMAPLRPPVQGEVVRRYGDAWERRGRSEGWSWRTAPGALVTSPSDGLVEYVGPLKNWGLVVILRRPDGWRAVIAGLQSAELAPGAPVRAQQPIGRMADRKAPPPELYLELRRGSEPVDPGPYLPQAPKPATR
jgi:septal ring factor EnvC (AmiA/AmiB activator)